MALVLGCGPGVGDDSSGGSTGGTEDSAESSETAGTSASTASASGATSAGADCDPFPNEGDPCSAPGTYCSGDCSDQCQFCNFLECREGVWSRGEAFPVPCLECEEVCTFIVPAGCAGGPPEQNDCVMGCEQVRAGPCASAYSDTLACIGETPTFGCDAEARPVVAGCEADFVALYACLGI